MIQQIKTNDNKEKYLSKKVNDPKLKFAKVKDDYIMANDIQMKLQNT